MTSQTFTDLHNRVIEIAIGREIARCEFGEMADGSRRSFALIVLMDDQDVALRTVTPAPAFAPAWARGRFQSWTTDCEAN